MLFNGISSVRAISLPGRGYVYLLNVLFPDPRNQSDFYNRLDICKWPNIGTNSSLALPYNQITYIHDRDWAEHQGVAKHIVRISVKLEPQDDRGNGSHMD